MHYLIDAYNLLFRSLKKRGPLEKNRQEFIEELNQIVAQLNLHVTLVFDGAEDHFTHPTRGHFDQLELIYTPKKQTADQYISDHVALSSNPSQITVVTNDRELAISCREHRAKILTIDQFLLFLRKKKTKKKKSTRHREAAFAESDPEIARLLLIFEKRMLENLTKDLE